MKDQNEKRQGQRFIGDAYTYVAFERNTKLVITWHLGRRTAAHTFAFTVQADEIREAIQSDRRNNESVSDDYRLVCKAIPTLLTIRWERERTTRHWLRIYGAPEDDNHKYSPSKIKESLSTPIWGNPNPERICTSHVERQNLNIRMAMRRFTRLTKRRLRCISPTTISVAFIPASDVPPAMESGITNHVWSLRELLA